MRAKNTRGTIMADVTMTKEAFEEYHVELSKPSQELSAGDKPKAARLLNWSVSSKEIATHIDARTRC